MTITEIRDNLADALNRVTYQGERIILKRRGKSMAALVPIEDLEMIERLEEEADRRALRKARKEKGFVTLEAVKKRLGLK